MKDLVGAFYLEVECLSDVAFLLPKAMQYMLPRPDHAVGIVVNDAGQHFPSEPQRQKQKKGECSRLGNLNKGTRHLNSHIKCDQV